MRASGDVGRAGGGGGQLETKTIRPWQLGPWSNLSCKQVYDDMVCLLKAVACMYRRTPKPCICSGQACACDVLRK